ncbi:hypothetical protein [Streptosporangium sp. H16]|uniref:hypothetical protein n=1 Tax=Streptosporangium sp. H16 TaxID=3444184 RepID=UPI003F796193
MSSPPEVVLVDRLDLQVALDLLTKITPPPRYGKAAVFRLAQALAERSEWEHLDGTVCVAGHRADARCAEGGGPVRIRKAAASKRAACINKEMPMGDADVKAAVVEAVRGFDFGDYGLDSLDELKDEQWVPDLAQAVVDRIARHAAARAEG